MENNNNNNAPKMEAPKPAQTNSKPNPVAPKQENNPKILKQMGLTSNDLGNELQPKKWNVGTLGGDTFDEPVKAKTEEEAFKVASQKYPGHGDELTVEEDNPKILNQMGLNDGSDIENNK